MPEKLKDQFFTTHSLGAFAESIKRQYPAFDSNQFLEKVVADPWKVLELKAKMRHVTRCLKESLPGDYVAALVILLKAAPYIKGFEGMTLPDFVEVYGMGHWEESLNALGQFTRYSSSEFAIRPFLDKDPKTTMHYMEAWAKSEYANVRRFASEGCRPRLPWAMVLPRFVADPQPVLKILDLLKDDESDFVRKSVANNLNDISKDHPELALQTGIRWYGYSDRTNRVVKHGFRTLLKQGNIRAMRLFGFGDPKHIRIQDMRATPDKLFIGEGTSLAFQLENTSSESFKVRLEYSVDYPKASGKTSRKVFQISEKKYEPGRTSVKKKHAFADLSTRKHYPGIHRIHLMVNGVARDETVVKLLPKSKKQ